MAELTIAIPKGRLERETVELFAAAGLRLDSQCDSRQLACRDESGKTRLIFVKPSDVPVYVEHGIADCGVVGSDVLFESEADLLQPLSLDFGCCRIAVAAPADRPENRHTMLRVATKYPRIASRYFGGRGQPVEIARSNARILGRDSQHCVAVLRPVGWCGDRNPTTSKVQTEWLQQIRFRFKQHIATNHTAIGNTMLHVNGNIRRLHEYQPRFSRFIPAGQLPGIALRVETKPSGRKQLHGFAFQSPFGNGNSQLGHDAFSPSILTC